MRGWGDRVKPQAASAHAVAAVQVPGTPPIGAILVNPAGQPPYILMFEDDETTPGVVQFDVSRVPEIVAGLLRLAGSATA
jgi:hypothetical protein